ncbi:MAG: TSUP family transporter [Clostridia bacterium]|nr:TSUP family transporter [Clostridia bacterium]
MIYLLISAVSAFFGQSAGLGATTLLRPVLDAVSPLSPPAIAAAATMATLCAALISAFFALSKPISLPQEELLLLAVGALLGGIFGDLAASRFIARINAATASLLQNALLFVLIAIPACYFSMLSRTLQPYALPRIWAFPFAMVCGLLASFLAFGAEPVMLMLCYYLFDADDDQAQTSALTVSLFAMSGKLITLLIRERFVLPGASVLIWLLPGALGGSLLAAAAGGRRMTAANADALLKLSLFTSLLNMAAAWL